MGGGFLHGNEPTKHTLVAVLHSSEPYQGFFESAVTPTYKGLFYSAIAPTSKVLGFRASGFRAKQQLLLVLRDTADRGVVTGAAIFLLRFLLRILI